VFKSIKQVSAGVGVFAAIALGAAGIAGAASSSNSATTTTAAATAAATPAVPAPGTAAHENSEAAVTGANATKAQAAAVKSVGSGTAGAVTADGHGDGYETTVTKADGSTVEVHLDSAFTVMQGHGGHGDGNNDAPAGTTTTG
jgi:hypothetical protein